MARRRGFWPRLGLPIALASFALGCVFAQHRAWIEARDAYLACVDDNGGDVDACKLERDEANRRYSEYEGSAVRAWGCQHAADCELESDPAFE